MKDLTTALEAYVDARIEVDRLTPKSDGLVTAGLGGAGSDLLSGAIERSNQARTDFASRLGKLLIHPPPTDTDISTIEKLELEQGQVARLWTVPTPGWTRAEFIGKDADGLYRFDVYGHGRYSFNGDVPAKPK